MKAKLTTFLIAILLAPIILFAQKDVTTFLGIPVDGYKAEMKKQLISKGFTPKVIDGTDVFQGEFNGTDVNVYIVTNNNKVYRIMVCDANTLDEANIKIRFNRLVSQFERNKRYSGNENQEIPENEDISYEMTVHNKIYEAIFYQVPDTTKTDYKSIISDIQADLLSSYSENQLTNPTEEIKQKIETAVMLRILDYATKKTVWFKIVELYGKYYIAMFYDNEYNHADGEDL